MRLVPCSICVWLKANVPMCFLNWEQWATTLYCESVREEMNRTKPNRKKITTENFQKCSKKWSEDVERIKLLMSFIPSIHSLHSFHINNCSLHKIGEPHKFRQFNQTTSTWIWRASFYLIKHLLFGAVFMFVDSLQIEVHHITLCCIDCFDNDFFYGKKPRADVT